MDASFGDCYIDRWRADPVKFVKEALFEIPSNENQFQFLKEYTLEKETHFIHDNDHERIECLTWVAWHFLACNWNSRVIFAVTNNKERIKISQLMRRQRNYSILSVMFEFRGNIMKHSDLYWCQIRKIDHVNPMFTLQGMCGDDILYILDDVERFPPRILLPARANIECGENIRIVTSGSCNIGLIDSIR